MIRLETSKRTTISNVQQADISRFQRQLYKELRKKYSMATPRTDMSAIYNCHGLTFASRRTRIERTSDVGRILADDNWLPVEPKDVLPGDIVVYYSSEGDANHSGVVVGFHVDLRLPIICSKWNVGEEYIHNLSDCPDVYGPDTKFYRCRL